jgi:hypothetical protein
VRLWAHRERSRRLRNGLNGRALPPRRGHRPHHQLIESAQDRWYAVNAPHLVALVRAGATLSN